MSYESITSICGTTNIYDFTSITSSQIQQAASALKSDGYLTTGEANLLSGMGSEISFSPIDGITSTQATDASWQSIPLNVISSLQQEINTSKTEDLGQDGQQTLATTESLFEKLSAYQQAETENSTGSTVSTMA